MVEGMKAKATKRSASRRKKASKVVAYVAKWDPARQRFIALDHDGVLLGLAHNLGLAMGIARTAAMRTAWMDQVRVTVMVEEDGKLKKKWVFDPPADDV
jgi:hypothetical protein